MTARVISVACPDCGHVYRVRGEMAGKHLRCKHCPGTVAVPSDTASAPEAPVNTRATMLEMPAVKIASAPAKVAAAPVAEPPVAPEPSPASTSAPAPAPAAAKPSAPAASADKQRHDDEIEERPLTLRDILTLPAHGDDLRVEAFALATGMLVRMAPLALVLILIPVARILCDMMEMTDRFRFVTLTGMGVTSIVLATWITAWAAQAQLGIVERFATLAVVSESRVSAIKSLFIFLLVLAVVVAIAALLIVPAGLVLAILRGDWTQFSLMGRLSYLILMLAWAGYAPIAMAAAALENTVNPVEVFRLTRKLFRPYALLVATLSGLLVALMVLQEAITTLPPAWLINQINPWTLTLITVWIGWSAYVCVLGMTGCLIRRYELLPGFPRQEILAAMPVPVVALLLAVVMIAARLNPSWSVNPITPSQRINGMWRLLEHAADKDSLDTAEMNRLLPDFPKFMQTYVESLADAPPEKAMMFDKGLAAIIRQLPTNYDPAELMVIPSAQRVSFALAQERVQRLFELPALIEKSCSPNETVRQMAAGALVTYFPFDQLEPEQLQELLAQVDVKHKRLSYERIQDEIFARWAHKLSGSYHLRFVVEWREADRTQQVSLQTLDPVLGVTSQERRVYVRTSPGGRAGLAETGGAPAATAGGAWAGTIEELPKLGVRLVVDFSLYPELVALLQTRGVNTADAQVLLQIKDQQWDVAGLQHSLPRWSAGTIDPKTGIASGGGETPGVLMVRCELVRVKWMPPSDLTKP